QPKANRWCWKRGPPARSPAALQETSWATLQTIVSLHSASVSNQTASHGQAVNSDADAPGGSTRVGRLYAWCARGTRIPSRHRGRRDLSTRRAQATAAVALSIQRGVFSVARQPDRVPVGHGHVDSSDAPSGLHRHAGVAGRLDFRGAAGAL